MDTGQSEPLSAPVGSPPAALVGATEERGPLAAVRPWAGLRPHLSRYRALLTVAVGVGLVSAGQLAEDLADSQPLQLLPPTFLTQRWTLITAVLYMIVSLEVIDRVVRRSLGTIQSLVRVDAATFRSYALRMQHPSAKVELTLVAVSATIVVLLFLVGGTALPASNDPVTRAQLFLPVDGISALFVLAGYTVVGWSGLRLVLGAVQVGRVIARLSRQPLDINIFDTSNLLPIGNIALAISLAPAGLIIILLVGLGQPGTPLGWTVLLLTTFTSVLALLLPLRGIHREMSKAKSAALARLGQQIREVDDSLAAGSAMDADQIGVLSDRTSALIPLRKTVQEMTTWPFRDTVTFGRAVLIASAPLVYTVLSELIKVIWIVPLSR
ncbi:MAG: hypothetical protein H0W00_02570 [Chloroflexi bacterium]|nr:hypothetical protein [Chloroflexota bacterium]